MKVILCHGQIIPAWYGIAYYDYLAYRAICYPMPLNIVVRVFRDITVWMRVGFASVDIRPRDAYLQGLKEGRNQHANHQRN
jgi:hypothetical protein